MHWLIEPGLGANASVHTALAVGVLVATVSAVVGLFTVVRGQSFAGHALTDVAAAGGAGAFLASLSPLAGFALGGLIGSASMEAVGVQRLRGRDVATGVVLGAATGLAALFFYLSATGTVTTGATQVILFGSIFSVSPATLAGIAILSVAVLGGVAVVARPLLLSSISPELAVARGISVRRIGIVFMALLALAVALSSVAIGSILSTALLIGPPASALRLVGRFGAGLVVAALLGVAATLAGVVVAYDSYYWLPSHRGLPVSFCVVLAVLIEFVASSLVGRRGRPGRGEA